MRAGHHRYTLADYLEISGTTQMKLEFLDGEIYAMAGGTPEHSALATAALLELGRQLDGKPCRPYNSDLRVRVQISGLSTYPDVTVICGEFQRDPQDRNAAVNPTVLVEVLADSTEAYDRGPKFEGYRTVASLKEYVLISHREKLIEVFRRGEGEVWTRSEARTEGLAKLRAIGCTLEVNRVYAGVELQKGR